MKRLFACMVVLLVQGYGAHISAVVDELVVDKVFDDAAMSYEREEMRREPKKTFEEWKKEIVDKKSVFDADADISEDVLKELYENYERSYASEQ
jgi:hypothetical protein